MNYRVLAFIYDWVAPRFSRYRSPALLTAKVLELAPASCDLLDVGVGTGLSIAPYINSGRFNRIIGVDPSAAMLNRCRRKFANLELYQGTLAAVQAKLGAPFDIIQSCGAVEHIADFAGFVAQIAALLKPHGHFVFTFEPEILFSARQSSRAPHIGTWGLEKVYRRQPQEVYAVLAGQDFEVAEDREFKAYLGLIHHLVIARKNPVLRSAC